MLVLNREPGDAIILTDSRTGQHIATLCTMATRPGRVSLGIAAPDHINVTRGELTTRTTGAARYVCGKCGAVRLSTGSGEITARCIHCDAFDWRTRP